MDDPHRLRRFVDAQDRGDVYAAAVAELRGGRKRSHWMWFVFPQLAGLGRSPIAQEYAIRSLAQARAYLAHPVLGSRLCECAEILVELAHCGAESASRRPAAVDVFGQIDALKLRSSMTLFARADPSKAVFARVLGLYFAGQPDPATLELLAADLSDRSAGQAPGQ